MAEDVDLKTKIFDAIMTDDLGAARSLAAQQPENFRLVADLLAQIAHNLPPLAQLRSDYPRYVLFPTTLTCNLGCPMCVSGFADKTSLYENRKYFHPSEFDALSPWIETAEYVHLLGVGETLDSPYIQEFLDKIKGKISIITTSGIPLTKEKIRLFIQSGLSYLNMSFEGKTSLGHGGGSDKYIDKFWKKMEMTQKIKKEHHSELPILLLSITVNCENADQLDELLATTLRHGITHVLMSPLLPLNASMYKESIIPDYETYKDDINKVLARWTEKGISFFMPRGKGEMADMSVSPPCPYIDNALLFNEIAKPICLCSGQMAMPMEPLNYPKNVFWNSFPLRYLRYLHFCAQAGDLPTACDECWLMNMKQYDKALTSCFDGGWNDSNEKAYSLYRTASRLKQDGRNAETLFTDALRHKMDPSLKGKIYFQLGELRLGEQKYPEALSFMTLAVRHCFDHRMAFVYLYLLMAHLEEPKNLPARKPTGSLTWPMFLS